MRSPSTFDVLVQVVLLEARLGFDLLQIERDRERRRVERGLQRGADGLEDRLGSPATRREIAAARDPKHHVHERIGRIGVRDEVVVPLCDARADAALRKDPRPQRGGVDGPNERGKIGARPKVIRALDNDVGHPAPLLSGAKNLPGEELVCEPGAEGIPMASTLRAPIVPPGITCPFSRAAIESAPATTYDPFGDVFLRDPYAVFEQLRVEAPVAYAPAIDMWTVTDYDDVDAIFKDPYTFSAAIAQSPLDPIAPEAQAILDEGFRPLAVMSNLDLPDHARIKAHTSRAFSARRISKMETVVRERATAMVEALPATGTVDLVAELAFPLPAVTIFKMIGFPDADLEMLKSWCGNRLVMTWGRTTAEEQQRIARQMVSYFTYCEAFVRTRAAEPADDLTSDLLATGLEDGTLSHAEIVSIIYGLSFAGHENITNMIANTVRRLLENPKTWAALVADPSHLPNTIEEALRFDSSNIAWRRVTTRPVTLRGVEIPKGARILVLLGAANHDPRKYPDPETFDIERKDARSHLAFGKGIHYCLGAALTRLELGIVLQLLTTRYPKLALGAERDYRYTANVVFRGPTALPVVLAG